MIIEGMIFLLGLLYIIEIEPLYSIIYFIGIVISMSIIIYKGGIIYVSLILVIVYATALIILFGFIMMKGKEQYPWSSYIIYWYSKDTISLSIFVSISTFLLWIIISSMIEPNINPEEIWIGGEEKIRRIGEILYSLPIEILLSALLLFFPIISLLYLS